MSSSGTGSGLSRRIARVVWMISKSRSLPPWRAPSLGRRPRSGPGSRARIAPAGANVDRDFTELYRYVEYPAIYHKERLLFHLRRARPGETPEQTAARSTRDISALLDSPFFDVWAQAAIGEILSALHERAVTSAPR